MDESVNRTKTWVPSDEGLAMARVHLGFRLRAERKRAGLSQLEAAGVAGVSQSAYDRFEKGSAVIGYGPLRLLAERYGCSMNELLPRESMLGAPRTPVERLVWVRERNRGIQRGVVKGPNPGPVSG